MASACKSATELVICFMLYTGVQYQAAQGFMRLKHGCEDRSVSCAVSWYLARPRDKMNICPYSFIQLALN